MADCPFKAGDIVIYAPSAVGRAKLEYLDIDGLTPGQPYTVVRVDKNRYLVLDGLEPTGFRWTEFRAS
jgi:hypothetical protein